ncbi:sigma-70 family RNA polymerase sigma factor [Bacillus sp. FJAT-50079]|uniref:RNA polymerase sigma factor n=1 Tax=Bacillus sp. FJAT-50079 TaxID=2833577 RepID=UPI0032D5A0B7
MDWEQVYFKYSDFIYRYILFHVRKKEVAEDLTQESFYRAFKHIHTFNHQASILTWLVKIARNVTYDYLRRKKLIHFFRLGKKDVVDDNAILPADQIVKNDRIVQLYEALSTLKTHYQAVIILRKINEHSIKETAYILGWTEAKVKSTMARAFAALKVEMLRRGKVMDEYNQEFEILRHVERSEVTRNASLVKIKLRHSKKRS